MKKGTKIFWIEMLFLLAMVVFVGVMQVLLTINAISNQIVGHLDEVEGSIQKYKKSEEAVSQNILELLEGRSAALALILYEETEPLSVELLESYADKLEADAIYVVDNSFQNIISTKGERKFNVKRNLEVRNAYAWADHIDEERALVVELDTVFKKLVEVMNDTFSWESSVVGSVVGRQGFTFVVNKETKKVRAHPDTSKEKMEVNFYGIDPVEMSNGKFSVIFLGEEPLFASLIEVENEGYADEYVICAVPLQEVLIDFLFNGLIYILVFLVITVLFICYTHFVEQRRDSERAYVQKLMTYPFLGGAVVLLICLFLSRMNAVSLCLMNCDSRAKDAAHTIENVNQVSSDIQELYDNEYLMDCRLAAEILTKIPEYRTREGMREISQILQAKYTYLFDKNGKTLVTDSPYDHFTISDDPESQSYEFLPLLDGADHVVQEPMLDDSSGDWMQYVGVSLRDENDLADGFVQLAINPEELQKVLDNINVATRLSEINAGEGGFSFVVDTQGIITISPKKRILNRTAKAVGIRKKQMTDGFSGYVTINDNPYFAAASMTNDDNLVFSVLPRDEIRTGQGRVVFLTGLMSLLCMLAMAFVAIRPGKVAPEKSRRKSRFGKRLKETAASRLEAFFGGWNFQMNETLERRWDNVFKSWPDRTPEEKVMTIVQAGLFILCVFIAVMYVYGEAVFGDNSLLLYIIRGKWEPGINIFAVTACLIIICIIYAVYQILQRILYWIARVSDTKTETICHLLRSLLKYGSVIALFYYCLAQFGIDTKTLVASAGILSVIIGFGAQKLVSDVISGLFLVFENQFSVDDIVDVGGWSGRVVEIGMRTTKIASFDDVKSFNNSEISGLINYKAKDVRLLSSEIAISYEESLERVMAIFKEELPVLKDKISGAVEEPFFDGVARLEDSGVVLVFRVKTKSDLKAPAERDFHRELLLLFGRHNIEIPYNHMTVDGDLKVRNR